MSREIKRKEVVSRLIHLGEGLLDEYKRVKAEGGDVSFFMDLSAIVTR